MRRTTLGFGSPEDITPRGMDGFAIRFPFTAVDTDLIGKPEETYNTTNHRLRVEVMQFVSPTWKMDEDSDTVKVILEFAKRELVEDLKRGGQLRGEFPVSMNKRPPFDPDCLQSPDGMTVEVEIREPMGYQGSVTRK
jgi:hypothetical protein